MKLKNQSIMYKFILFFMLSPSVVLGEFQHKKRVTIDKSYTVSDLTLLKIDNQFGDIMIHSWSKQEFSISVEIIVESRSEARIERLLENIEVDVRESDIEIYFETNINSGIKSKEKYKINYQVYMPENNPLHIKNQFGDVSMGDRKEKLYLDVSYGAFKINDLYSNKVEIELAFGNGSINHMQDGKIHAKYSHLNINKTHNIELSQSFSDVEIKEVNNIDLISKYGNVELGNAHNIDAEAKYSDFEIEELTGFLEMECSYLGGFEIEKLSKTFTKIDIEGKYGSYDIGLEEGLNANIDATFHYADLKLDSDINVTFYHKIKDNNKIIYRGKIGSGDELKKIKIYSHYGSLYLER